MNEQIKTLIVVLSLAAVTALSTTTMTQTARAQNADWILNVHVNNVNFGEPTIGISVNGPYGYHDYQSIRNGPAPFAQFTIPGSAVPTGSTFEVCASTGILGAFLPHCQRWIYEGFSPTRVTVTP
jgi:hypothetical protein